MAYSSRRFPKSLPRNVPDPTSTTVCPNSCEVGSVPRCDLKAHLMVCPLQPVTCEYAEVGCDVKVPRRDLGHHMEKGQQQHLLSATLLNLRLTRENTEEKKRLLRLIEEKEAEHKKELATRDQQIIEKEEKIEEVKYAIYDLQTQLEQMQYGLEVMVTELQQQVVKYGKDTQEHLKQQDKHFERLMFGQLVQFNLAYIRQGFSVHDFTLTEFKKCQGKGGVGDWYSESFYSHPGGYKFQLNICTNGDGDDRGVNMTLFFKLLEGDHDDKLPWPVSITAHVQLLNQLGDHNHHEKTSTGEWEKIERGEHYGGIREFIELSELGLSAASSAQYLKNDCLLFRVYMKTEPAH